MSQGFYGFPNILGLVRATSFKAIGKAGATNGAALAGGTASGAPVAPAGPFDVGDVIADASGKLWICTTAGTSQSSPGSFTQVGGTTSPLTTKGDVWVYGSADSRLGVGSDGQVITADSTQSLGVKWGAAGAGSGGALTFIQSQTVAGSSAASVTFSSIPGTYTHLELRYIMRATGSNGFQQLSIRFNGDTASNYNDMAWDSGGQGGASTTSIVNGYVAGGNNASGSAAAGVFVIPFYAQTTFWKVLTNRSYSGIGLARDVNGSGTWKSTAAITSITILLDANNIDVGSMFYLYGVS